MKKILVEFKVLDKKNNDIGVNLDEMFYESADQLLVQLNSLPPSAAGAQLLRLFFIDILGTDTPEAKIFGSKSGIFFNDTKVSLL